MLRPILGLKLPAVGALRYSRQSLVCQRQNPGSSTRWLYSRGLAQSLDWQQRQRRNRKKDSEVGDLSVMSGSPALGEMGGSEPKDANGDPPLSKRQQKKLLKKEAAKQGRQGRKQAKKEEAKLKAAEKRRQIDERINNMTPEEREAYRQKSHAASQDRILNKARQKEKLKQALTSGQHVIIDLDFADEMTKDQVTSLCQQLSFCHAINSAAETPLHLELSSMAGTVGQQLRGQVSGVDNWPVTFTDSAYTDKYKDALQDLVYLSADSDQVLTELDSKKRYIIGGIVDRNRHKGLCEAKARQQGIATAKLPLRDHADLIGNKVLTVNQVFEMLVGWMAFKDWSKAIEQALPQRKVQKRKQGVESEADRSEEPDSKSQKVEE